MLDLYKLLIQGSNDGFSHTDFFSLSQDNVNYILSNVVIFVKQAHLAFESNQFVSIKKNMFNDIICYEIKRFGDSSFYF